MQKYFSLVVTITFSVFFSINEALSFTYPQHVQTIIESKDISSQELINTLHVFVSETHQELNYTQARKIMFGDLFLEKKGDNKFIVKDVYCNKNIDETAGVGPDRIPNPEILNCEHTWPQSKFSKKFPSELQKSDLHHLFPSDMKANSTRNNYPFAEVNGRPTHATCQDSAIGNSLEGGVYSFEPPLEHRGNVARAMVYFSVRYEMPIDDVQKKYFVKWNLEDPVDQEEIIRQEKIMAIQGNRNPFIDHPELLQRL